MSDFEVAEVGEVERLRRELAAARERIAALERVLRMAQSLADDVDQGQRGSDCDEWRIPWSRHAVEVFSEIANALAAPGAEGKAETAAEHFGQCGPFCTHVEHCHECVEIMGDCGRHANPNDNITWKSATPPPEPPEEYRCKVCGAGRFEVHDTAKHEFGAQPEERGKKMDPKDLSGTGTVAEVVEAYGSLGHNRPEDIMRKLGWLSPAEAAETKTELWAARVTRDRLEKLADEQRARAKKAEAQTLRVTELSVQKNQEYQARAERAERERDEALGSVELWKTALNVQVPRAEAERDAARARADSLEAQCAAMREALALVKPGWRDVSSETYDLVSRALQSDAGRGYVRAERLREVSKAFWEMHRMLPTGTRIEGLGEARRVLATLDALLYETGGGKP